MAHTPTARLRKTNNALRVFLPIIYHELTHCIARAFEAAGHEVRVVDWRKFGKDVNKHKIEPLCIREAMDFRPDLCFAQFQAPGLITTAFPKALKSIGCFSAQWSGDVRYPLPDWYKELAPHFDVTSFSNMTDVEEIRSLGHRSEFLQIGYDERLYNTEGAGERSGVVFIGNNYGAYKFAESDSRRKMVEAMVEAFGDDFRVYGMSWELAGKSNGGYVREPADAEILKRALVAVGFDHFHRPWFASDRLLRATACGCAVVNQYYEGIEVEHPVVSAVRSIDEMVDRVRFYLDNPVVAGIDGRDSATNTLKNHTWDNRVKIIEGWL